MNALNDWKIRSSSKVFTKSAGRVIIARENLALNISYLSVPNFLRIPGDRGVYFMAKVRFLGRDKLTYVACHWLKICCTTAQSPGDKLS